MESFVPIALIAAGVLMAALALYLEHRARGGARTKFPTTLFLMVGIIVALIGVMHFVIGGRH
jgi:uncharacterized membrane protein YidH (DUF202 family)